MGELHILGVKVVLAVPFSRIFQGHCFRFYTFPHIIQERLLLSGCSYHSFQDNSFFFQKNSLKSIKRLYSTLGWVELKANKDAQEIYTIIPRRLRAWNSRSNLFDEWKISDAFSKGLDEQDNFDTFFRLIHRKKRRTKSCGEPPHHAFLCRFSEMVLILATEYDVDQFLMLPCQVC